MRVPKGLNNFNLSKMYTKFGTFFHFPKQSHLPEIVIDTSRHKHSVCTMIIQ